MTDKTRILNSTYYSLFLWMLALILIGSGIYLSKINYMDLEWLSRAGCLVVMLGIWSGLGILVQEQLIIAKLKWQRRRTLSATRARLSSEGKDHESIKVKLEEIDHAFDKRSQELRQSMKLSLGMIEISLLLTGTLLWGFGDLFLRYI
ncbi:MAG: hypothetical protein AAF410_00545 [Pseudomonadota bacterium]